MQIIERKAALGFIKEFNDTEMCVCVNMLIFVMGEWIKGLTDGWIDS